MKTFIISLFLFCCTLGGMAQGTAAQGKQKADNAYAAEQYETAARLYLDMTRMGENADVYYNLGNCYYRMDSIAQAILWYERALLLNPGDEDIRFNLNLVRTKTVDKIVPEDELFFSRWYHSLLNTMSVNGWVWTSIVFFALVMVGLLLFLFGQQMMLRKVGFYGGIVCLVAMLCGNLFAWQQRNRRMQRDSAVVMQSSVVVKSTPAQTGTDLFLLHTGTTMKVLDNSLPDWYQIRLSDGKEGWIPTSAIEVI